VQPLLACLGGWVYPHSAPERQRLHGSHVQNHTCRVNAPFSSVRRLQLGAVGRMHRRRFSA